MSSRWTPTAFRASSNASGCASRANRSWDDVGPVLVAPHEPHAPAPGQRGFASDIEAERAVVGHVGGTGGLEVQLAVSRYTGTSASAASWNTRCMSARPTPLRWWTGSTARNHR